jgi:hypothetical protein
LQTHADSFIFTSSSQSWLAISGTGGAGRSDTAVITFQLVDANGDAVTSGKSVSVTLDGPSGTSLSADSDTSDDSGYVSTSVSSGKVPGTVSVHVELDEDSTITSVSNLLAVTTGLPDQNSFSLSIENFAPEVWDTDGVSVGVTVRLSDHNNNTVPDGTVVFFQTEGGTIINSSEATGFCSTSQGTCSVEWISSNPRPDDGRVTITAYAEGEESFTDKDADGWFTEGDIFTINTSSTFNGKTDLGEVFYDYNENGVYDEDSTEEFVDIDSDANPLDGSYNEGDGIFTGILCSDIQEALGNCVNSLVQVRKNIGLIMATSGNQCEIYANGTNVTNGTIDLTSVTSAELILVMQDMNGNTPATNTSVLLTTENGTLSDTSWTVVPPSDLGEYTETSTLESDNEDGETSGLLELTLTSPDDGETSTCSATVIDNG